MKKIEKPIELGQAEREKLLMVLEKGTPKEILYANILLMSDKGFTPKKIAEALNTTKQTVNNVKQKYFTHGLGKCLVRKNAGKAPYAPKITGDVEAKIVTLACSSPPEGRSSWALRLLADKAVELQYIDAISYVSVATILKKHNLSLT